MHRHVAFYLLVLIPITNIFAFSTALSQEPKYPDRVFPKREKPLYPAPEYREDTYLIVDSEITWNPLRADEGRVEIQPPTPEPPVLLPKGVINNEHFKAFGGSPLEDERLEKFREEFEEEVSRFEGDRLKAALSIFDLSGADYYPFDDVPRLRQVYPDFLKDVVARLDRPGDLDRDRLFKVLGYSKSSEVVSPLIERLNGDLSTQIRAFDALLLNGKQIPSVHLRKVLRNDAFPRELRKNAVTELLNQGDPVADLYAGDLINELSLSQLSSTDGALVVAAIKAGNPIAMSWLRDAFAKGEVSDTNSFLMRAATFHPDSKVPSSPMGRFLRSVPEETFAYGSEIGEDIDPRYIESLGLEDFKSFVLNDMVQPAIEGVIKKRVLENLTNFDESERDTISWRLKQGGHSESEIKAFFESKPTAAETGLAACTQNDHLIDWAPLRINWREPGGQEFGRRIRPGGHYEHGFEGYLEVTQDSCTEFEQREIGQIDFSQGGPAGAVILGTREDEDFGESYLYVEYFTPHGEDPRARARIGWVSHLDANNYIHDLISYESDTELMRTDLEIQDIDLILAKAKGEDPGRCQLQVKANDDMAFAIEFEEIYRLGENTPADACSDKRESEAHLPGSGSEDHSKEAKDRSKSASRGG